MESFLSYQMPPAIWDHSVTCHLTPTPELVTVSNYESIQKLLTALWCSTILNLSK